MSRVRFIGRHAEDLDDGSVVEPGAFYDLSDSALRKPIAKRLHEEGRLIDAPEEQAAPEAPKAEGGNP